jgi:hypothetical protein
VGHFTPDYIVSGLCPSSDTLKEQDVLENGSFSTFKVLGYAQIWGRLQKETYFTGQLMSIVYIHILTSDHVNIGCPMIEISCFF